ncbi:hypothetical protein S40293_03570 [Stachybotrys chartarum IBT 40293]|nr:hypothetical protein S40293_03570 [Stachybotrys chartarum IBT 40293]
MAPIPITLVTGFLGSGKTTLILNLIPQLRAQNPDYKLALLKNEFGDLAVDSQLASSSAISGTRELLGGCICCNLVGQLGPALEELEQAADPDRVVIETSGSAFPDTLVFQINELNRKTGKYFLDGVISVVDVENWKGYAHASPTALMQAKYTDLLVFNKWETAGEDRYEECLDKVKEMSPYDDYIPVVKSDKGKVDVDVLFGTDKALARDLTQSGSDQETSHDGHPHDHAHEHKDNHQSEVEVLSIELKGPAGASVSPDKLLKLLQTASKYEVFRIKAVATLSATPENSDARIQKPEASPSGRYILNWAFGRWTFTPTADTVEEHASSGGSALRMTMILARYEANKWLRKLERGGFLEIDGEQVGALTVKRLL